jgi:hypothetical protein
MISSKIRTLSQKTIFEDNYEKNLRINDHLGIFIIVKYSTFYTIVAKEKISLDKVLSDLGLLVGVKKDNKTYNSDIVFDGKISENGLNGKIKFVTGIVDISVISERKKSEKNFDTIINKWNKLLSCISESNYEELKIELSKEMTKEAFSQYNIDNKSFSVESQKLYKDLKIEKVILTIDSIAFLFNAKKEYPDGAIRVILKKDGSLDEYYFE